MHQQVAQVNLRSLALVPYHSKLDMDQRHSWVNNMNHVITLHDVVWTSGIVIGIIIVLAGLVGILSVLGSAMKD